MVPNDLMQPLHSKKSIILSLLHNRKPLCESSYSKYNQLMKGHDGEQQFFKRLKAAVHPSAIIINNLILHSDDSEVQIDSILIVDNNIYLFEVKNYYGDYLIKDDLWYNIKNKQEIRNPLLQLNRSRYFIQKIIQQQNFKFNLYTYLIFINQQFTLYMPSPNKSIILPTQLNRFLTHLSNQPFKHEKHHMQLLNYLINNRLEKSSYMTLPEYTFNQLKKGITCKKCNEFLVRYNKSNMKCSICRKVTKITDSLIKAIEEFQILFPTKKITTSIIYEWCGKIVSKKTIIQVLNQNYKRIGQGKSTYYVNHKNTN